VSNSELRAAGLKEWHEKGTAEERKGKESSFLGLERCPGGDQERFVRRKARTKRIALTVFEESRSFKRGMGLAGRRI